MFLMLCAAGAREAAAGPATAAPELRDVFFKVARPSVSNLLVDTENKTGLKMFFMALKDNDEVGARFIYNPHLNEAQIQLRKDWQDVDVAHELMHTRMDLNDRFAMLAWRRDVPHTPEIEAAFARVQTYVKDEVVHANLVKMGLRLDGEIIHAALFDSVYANATRYLEEGRDRANDGMAHLDKLGRGTLCRVCFLVQAELLLKNYRTQLPTHRIEQTERFIRTFREHRKKEAAEADAVLELFRKYDVNNADGHREILAAWVRIDGLDKFVGVSSYVKSATGECVLPFPD